MLRPKIILLRLIPLSEQPYKMIVVLIVAQEEEKIVR